MFSLGPSLHDTNCLMNYHSLHHNMCTDIDGILIGMPPPSAKKEHAREWKVFVVDCAISGRRRPETSEGKVSKRDREPSERLTNSNQRWALT